MDQASSHRRGVCKICLVLLGNEGSIETAGNKCGIADEAGLRGREEPEERGHDNIHICAHEWLRRGWETFSSHVAGIHGHRCVFIYVIYLCIC